jgi:hypothetical protein
MAVSKARVTLPPVLQAVSSSVGVQEKGVALVAGPEGRPAEYLLLAG